jgi:glutamate-1-semialdehyde 2,1-aminomutase
MVIKNFKNSIKLLKEARKIIPTGSQTFSKSTYAFSEGASPMFLDKGKGCYAFDVDHNKFIDYVMGCQPLILGYSDKDINLAITNQLKKGSTFSLNNQLEIDVARLLIKHIPCAEAVRFGKNGADATSASIKIARAATKKDHVAFCGYHGWHDWFIANTNLDSGIPKNTKKLTHSFNFNDINSLKRIFKEYKNKVSCVIMEPITVSKPACAKKRICKNKKCRINCKFNFLHEVKKECKKNNCLLIFDEVVTGFRYSLGGAQKVFDVTPDLACFAKAISNGVPLSAVVGKKKYMNYFNKVFFSFTYGGECIGLAAAKACIEKLERLKVLQHINTMGRILKNGINNKILLNNLENYFCCVGEPCRTVLQIKSKNEKDLLIYKTFIQQELIKNGILWSGYHTISWMHKTKDIQKTIMSFDNVFKKFSKLIKSNKKIKDHLDGKMCKQILTRVADFNAASLSKVKN